MNANMAPVVMLTAPVFCLPIYTQPPHYFAPAHYGPPCGNWTAVPPAYHSPPPCTTPPSPPQPDQVLRKLCLSRKSMLTNGFPVKIIDYVTIEPNQWQQNRKMFYRKSDRTRVCIRCHSTYHVDASGLQSLSAEPVCGANHFHITDQQPEENLKKFKSTFKATRYNTHCSDKLFAVDVEMIYTQLGQEVGRVTMVNESGEVLVDTKVRPSSDVMDPVTEFSGLTREDVCSAKVDLEAARKMILRHVNERSILVGHGLNGDLKALRLIHDRVIDTSVIYSINGRKPSLKSLTMEHLGYQIQNGARGHCSREDATAAMKLVQFAVEHPELVASKRF